MARRPDPGARARILGHAEQLFYTKGVRAVGLQEVIDTCGCGKSLLYREFASKEELVLAYVDVLSTRWRHVVSQRLAPLKGDASAQLLELVAVAAEQTTESDYRGCAFRVCLDEFPDPDSPVGRAVRTHLSAVQQDVMGLAQQVSGGELALGRRIWLIIEGMYGAAARPGGEAFASVGLELAAELINRVRDESVAPAAVAVRDA